MRLAALLAWFDERPSDLKEMVASLTRVGATDLVALDGAYGLLPDGAPVSPKSNLAALEKACTKHRIQLTHAAPNAVWPDEMTKRSCLFSLADTTNADWYLVIDADEVVTVADPDLHSSLAESVHDVATLRFHDKDGVLPNLRRFFRAIPGIQVVGNHYTYVTPDGRKLSASWDVEREPETPTKVEVRHKRSRQARRERMRRGYYEARDTSGIERGVCVECGAPATTHGPTGWFMDAGELKARFVEACELCACAMNAQKNVEIAARGLKPLERIPNS